MRRTLFFSCHFLDRLVVLGNARESLIPSGEDPLAATAILLELARVFGRLKADQGFGAHLAVSCPG